MNEKDPLKSSLNVISKPFNFSKNLSFLNFFLLGLSTLIGWNVVLTSLDFFSSRFPNYDIDFLMVIPCDIGTLFANFVIGFFIKNFSIKQRIISSLIFLAVLVILLPLETQLLPNANGFWLFMALNFGISGFMVFLQGSILGLAGNYPDYCMAAINSGFSVSGVLTCGLRALCLLLYKDQEIGFDSMLIYYASGTVLILITLYVYIRFLSLEERDNVALLKNETINEEENQEIYGFFIKSIVFTSPYSFLMILINIQTFLLFPGLALSYSLFNLQKAWNEVILLLLFNVFDTIGRYCSLYKIFYRKYQISVVIMLRFLFIGSFIVLFKKENIGFINNAYFAIGNMAIFAFSNGYLITALFILPTEMYKDGRDKELVGFVMSFMLNLGCIIGSLIALSFASI